MLVGLPTPKPTTPDELLPPRLAASVVGVVAGARHEAMGLIVERAAEHLPHVQGQREAEGVDAALTAAAKRGRATAGLEGTLAAVNRDAVHRLRAHASQDGTANRTDPPASQADLELLCATYLSESGKSTGVNSDPVARFHLNNGARLERINPQADLSPKGLAQSFGMMVNYVYDLRQIERNHESFVEGRVGMSRKIRRLVS